jgi:hypothetical protein
VFEVPYLPLLVADQYDVRIVTDRYDLDVSLYLLLERLQVVVYPLIVANLLANVFDDDFYLLAHAYLRQYSM